MKKLLALVMALMMALSCFTALAEEPAKKTGLSFELPAITVTDEITLNEEAIMALLPIMSGISEESVAMFQPIIALLNNLSFKAVTDEYGLQFDVNLKGQNILTLAGEMTENGVALATDLLPSYAFTLSYETIKQAMEARNLKIQEVLANVDMEKLVANVMSYSMQYSSIIMSSVTMGETEFGEFYIEANDYTFNTCTPITVDTEAIAAAVATLAEQLKNDETVNSLISALNNAGFPVQLNGGINIVLPKVAAWTYANVDEEGYSLDGVTYIVVEATFDDPSKDFDVKVLVNENGVMVTVFVPTLDTDVVMAVNPTDNGLVMVIETEIQEMYIGAKATLFIGETINLDCDLFFQDPENPILCEKVVVAFEGERTFTVLGENKTVVDAADLVGETINDELRSSLLGDVYNGLNGLLAKAAAVMPEEVTALMNLMMGAPAVEEAAE